MLACTDLHCPIVVLPAVVFTCFLFLLLIPHVNCSLANSLARPLCGHFLKVSLLFSSFFSPLHISSFRSATSHVGACCSQDASTREPRLVVPTDRRSVTVGGTRQHLGRAVCSPFCPLIFAAWRDMMNCMMNHFLWRAGERDLGAKQAACIPTPLVSLGRRRAEGSQNNYTTAF